MKEFHYPLLDERLYKTTLPNGLDVCIIPRPGFSKKLAYFVTDFGAIHTSFSLDGTEYTVPEKECISPSSDDPCKMFKHMAFPVNEFYPPALCDLKGETDSGCGCKK